MAGGVVIVAAQSPDTGVGELLWLDPTTLVVQRRVALDGFAPVTPLSAPGNVVWGAAGANIVGYNVATGAKIATPDLSLLPPHPAVGVDAFTDVSLDATGTTLYAATAALRGQWLVIRPPREPFRPPIPVPATAPGVPEFCRRKPEVCGSPTRRARSTPPRCCGAWIWFRYRLNTHVGEVLWTTQAASLQLVCLDPTTGNPIAGTNSSPITFAHDAAGGESPTRYWLRVAPAPSCPRLRDVETERRSAASGG